MSINESPSKDNSLPDMNAIVQSLKIISRAVPALKDGSYSYFADSMNMGSTIAANINNQITDALTSLPTSLEKMKSAAAFTKNIEKINTAENLGQIDSYTATYGSKQLEDKLNEELSSILISFNTTSNNLSESAGRISHYSKNIDVRLKDAKSTEMANYDRAKSDTERESARLNTLEDRYEKMNNAVDEKRGGPTDELIAIIPDKKELSSLLDVGADDAATPEVAAAKKGVELAVAEIKKVLEAMGNTIEFVQLANMRDKVFKAMEAQRKVLSVTTTHMNTINQTLGELETVKSAGNAMNSLAEEVNKMVVPFSSFTNSLKSLDGKEITETTMTNLYESMSNYLDNVRTAKNNVILG